MHQPMSRLSALALLFAGLVCAGPAFPDDDQDRAREALQKGEIRPLEEVLAVLQATRPGEVLKLELKREDGRWLYKFKVLVAHNQRREVEIDARSLQIVEDENDDDD